MRRESWTFQRSVEQVLEAVETKFTRNREEYLLVCRAIENLEQRFKAAHPALNISVMSLTEKGACYGSELFDFARAANELAGKQSAYEEQEQELAVWCEMLTADLETGGQPLFLNYDDWVYFFR